MLTSLDTTGVGGGQGGGDTAGATLGATGALFVQCGGTSRFNLTTRGGQHLLNAYRSLYRPKCAFSRCQKAQRRLARTDPEMANHGNEFFRLDSGSYSSWRLLYAFEKGFQVM